MYIPEARDRSAAWRLGRPVPFIFLYEGVLIMTREEELIQILSDHPELLEIALTLVIEQLQSDGSQGTVS